MSEESTIAIESPCLNISEESIKGMRALPYKALKFLYCAVGGGDEGLEYVAVKLNKPLESVQRNAVLFGASIDALLAGYFMVTGSKILADLPIANTQDAATVINGIFGLVYFGGHTIIRTASYYCKDNKDCLEYLPSIHGKIITSIGSIFHGDSNNAVKGKATLEDKT